MSVINGNLSDGKPMEKGGYYNGQAWDGTKLLAPGLDFNGKPISNEVIAQTNPNNVKYIQQQQQLPANQIQAPVSLSLPSGQSAVSQNVNGLNGQVDIYRKQLDTNLATQKATADAALVEAKKAQQDTLNKEQALSTPFAADLQTAQMESLHVNKNFEDNQKLVDELDSLLTQGNDLIKQQQSVTGLAAIRNPRIQKTMNDVSARAGVIQAVMSARNSQISVAENMIDRSINAIQLDRKDQLNYYDTVLQLQRADVLSLDKESKDIAQQQVDLIKNDMIRSQDTADYVKKLLIDPATAQLMGQAGVSLNDSVDQINAKIANAQYANEVFDMSNKIMLQGGRAVIDPSSIPAAQLVTITDSRGQNHYYQALPGTFGTTKPTGGSASDKADAKRQADFTIATKFIQDNPKASKEEMTVALRQYTSLSPSDIAIALSGAPQQYSSLDLMDIATQLIDKATTSFGQTQDGKNAAIDKVDKDSRLTDEQKTQVKQIINDKYPTGNSFLNWFGGLFK